jgi:hypothetical protein
MHDAAVGSRKHDDGFAQDPRRTIPEIPTSGVGMTVRKAAAPMRTLLIPLLLGLANPVAAAEQSPRIRLELQCRRTAELVATIHNEGTADTALIFGTVLGNGVKYTVDHLSLSIRTEGQPEYFRMYRPKHYPAVIGGSLDDWIMPLPVGSSFSLLLHASDFEGWRSVTSLPPATLALRLEVRGPSRSASGYAQFFRVWTDKDALVSNEIHVPNNCR